MNVIEKRDYIHSHLHQIDDSMVNEVYKKIYSYIDDKGENLSEDLKAALDQGLESLEHGKSSSHEDVMARMKKKYPGLIK